MHGMEHVKFPEFRFTTTYEGSLYQQRWPTVQSSLQFTLGTNSRPWIFISLRSTSKNERSTKLPTTPTVQLRPTSLDICFIWILLP